MYKKMIIFFGHYLYLSTPLFKFIANSKKIMLKLNIINKWTHAVFISPKTMELQERLSFILQMSRCSFSIVIRQVQATLDEAQIETDLD